MTTEAQERVDDDNETDQQKKSIPDLAGHWWRTKSADEPFPHPINQPHAYPDDEEHQKSMHDPIAVREDNFSQHCEKGSPG